MASDRHELPTFSVIIPTFNRREVGRRSLLHFLACDYPDDRYEIIVCDNSHDGTPDMVRELAATSPVPIHLLYNDERLPAVKRNQALAVAGGDYVVFMNDDVWVRPDFLREHLRTHLEWAPEPVAVAGYCEQSLAMPDTAYNRWHHPFPYDDLADLADQPIPYSYNWSMNLSLPRREMLDRNLVFHEDWQHIGHEDVELGYRWQLAGNKTIHNPKAWGEHFHPHSLDSTCRLQESVGRGLRDLERLIPDRALFESYGHFSWRNSPRAVARQLARRALFNSVTAPILRRRLNDYPRSNRVVEWMYPKVALHYSGVGYRSQPPSSTVPTPFRDRPASGAEVAA